VTNAVVLATIRKHLAETELRLAVLRSKREEIPATRGGMVAASRIARQITQTQSQYQSWTDVLNAAETIGDE
jgi:hypothetical protein